MMAEKVRMVLAKQDKSKMWLAKKLGWAPSSLYSKLKKDNFTEQELNDIANALDCSYTIQLTLKENGQTF